MAEPPFTLIDEREPHQVEATCAAQTAHIAPAALAAALGWMLKPEGLCKDDRCVPIRDRAALVQADGVDLAAFAALIGRPLALDVEARAACLGTPAASRAARLASLEAPDFTLPDLDGTPHTLSAYRGKKVLLVAYASW